MCASEADTGGFRKLGPVRHKRKSATGQTPSQTPTGRAPCSGRALKRDYIRSSDQVWSPREPPAKESTGRRSEDPLDYLTDHAHPYPAEIPSSAPQSAATALRLPAPGSCVVRRMNTGFLFKTDSGCFFIRARRTNPLGLRTGPPHAWSRAYASLPDHKSSDTHVRSVAVILGRCRDKIANCYPTESSRSPRTIRRRAGNQYL
jgi:hypothetical protein